jgi:hypothetical protein
VGVFVDGAAATRLSVDASSIESFRAGWHRLAGTRGLVRELHPTGSTS